MRKITAIILTLVLVFATATSAFANEDNYMLIKKTDPTEKYLKGAIENLDVVAAKKTIGNEIIAQKDDITVKFPTKENKNINIECDGENVVSMEIPKDNESPYIARNGSNEVYMVQKYKVLMRWKDSATGDITWREISRNAKTTEFVGVSGQCVKTAEV